MPKIRPHLLLAAVCTALSATAFAADSTFAIQGAIRLQDDTPLNRLQYLGAHNAWNDSSATWANQRLPMDKLLEGGVRNIDLDLHWDGDTVKLCHNKCGQIYSADDSYPGELRKIQEWLLRNPKDIVFIDLEDRVANQAAVEGPLKAIFGNLLYLPSDKPAGRWETPREMVAKGKRVIVKSANEIYDNKLIWNEADFAFGAQPGWNSRQAKFVDVANCTMDGLPIDPRKHVYTISDNKLGKDLLPDSWVDSTGTIDASNIPGMQACGIQIIDADRWDDAQFAAAVWNWAPGEPNNYQAAEHCAQVGGNGRWNDAVCASVLPYACQNLQDADDWKVTVAQGTWTGGVNACAREYPGYRFAVPATPYQNRMLKDKLAGQTAWLAYSDMAKEGDWQSFNSIATEWRAGVNANNASLYIPGAAALSLRVQGNVAAATNVLNVYDSKRNLVATVAGNGQRDLFVADGGAILEYLGPAVTAPGYLTVTASATTSQAATPVYRRLVNGKGKCLDLEGRNTNNGTSVHHWSCNGASSQSWWQDDLGRLRPQAAPAKCAEAAGGTGDGTAIVLADCSLAAGQRWMRGANNSFRLAGAPNQALDIKDSWWGAFDGQDAHLWGAHGGWSQQWTWQ
ncbi:ricin-type beta-trefoil lectin domain protein [Parachitinimonas caeni]|uniref:1-phosphatidylinositol phosphodiesterase n=1 Tax=Parachitinimonas caeni TaxID=3031301 RepID=A0ABT7E1F7_9NEIS|nr:ricin-type beta-trefoil lectin domain protein [Parachitinimonas caeni]MDK2126155.1 ricin-type beta-trefoil lectin domain protein [Parachitinimonas caeni]